MSWAGFGVTVWMCERRPPGPDGLPADRVAPRETWLRPSFIPRSRTVWKPGVLVFAFDNVDTPGFTAYAGPDALQSLADEIHGSWVRFIKTGVPADDWKPYSSEADIRIFGPAGQRNIDVLSAWAY
ncbi:hypothetical protein MHPYR_40096 [uncultured Mycobacterium sp.]|uniref:Carboxylesterase type B domain-containing protein n=1 Tax=uncultured Mycobacterium sp. TaxID=171292 RepID=A0A1Y5PEF0_9MYCO|nr:hypothetical protein MHPYR_40096 [uncultured Mycobacterium sp.]